MVKAGRRTRTFSLPLPKLWPFYEPSGMALSIRQFTGFPMPIALASDYISAPAPSFPRPTCLQSSFNLQCLDSCHHLKVASLDHTAKNSRLSFAQILWICNPSFCTQTVWIICYSLACPSSHLAVHMWEPTHPPGGPRGSIKASFKHELSFS